jgi:hypothetical protein
MADANEYHFKAWLANEIELARREAANRQEAFDAKAAAEGGRQAVALLN